MAPAGLMRIPGRLHITWQDDTTLKVEADAGTQTRIFYFGAAARPGRRLARRLDGLLGPLAQPARISVLRRSAVERRFLAAVTTKLKPGYLAQERSSLQREHRHDRIFRPLRRTRRRFPAGGFERSGRSHLPGRNLSGPARISRSRTTRRAGIRRHVRRANHRLRESDEKNLAVLLDCTSADRRCLARRLTAKAGRRAARGGPCQDSICRAIGRLRSTKTPSNAGAGPEIADYGGFPINEAGRLFALVLRRLARDARAIISATATSRPIRCARSATSASGKSAIRTPASLIAIHWCNQTFEGHPHHLDGRPSASARLGAAHLYGIFDGHSSWAMRWWSKPRTSSRAGCGATDLPESDQATIVEFFVRHGDHLTDTSVVTDPVYLTEPEVRSNDFVRQPVDHGTLALRLRRRRADSRPSAGCRCPIIRLGKQPFAKEYSEKYKIPLLASIAGAESMYPEFAAKLKTATEADALAKTATRADRPSANQPRRGSGTARRRNPCAADSAITSTCWWATAETSSCRRATRGRSWSIPERASCPTR